MVNDAQPSRQDPGNPAREPALSAWMATEAFTEFVAATFDAAVKRAVKEQAAKGVTGPT